MAAIKSDYWFTNKAYKRHTYGVYNTTGTEW